MQRRGRHDGPPPHVVESALPDLLFAAADAHDRDQVAAIAERIVRDAPARPVAADAWLAIGERAFEGGLEPRAAAFRAAWSATEAR